MSLYEIKNVVRDWFATLSIREIQTNEKLSILFELIELHFQKIEEES